MPTIISFWHCLALVCLAFSLCHIPVSSQSTSSRTTTVSRTSTSSVRPTTTTRTTTTSSTFRSTLSTTSSRITTTTSSSRATTSTSSLRTTTSSTSSTSSSRTTTTTSSSPVPTTPHRLIGYWQNWATNGVVLPLTHSSVNNYDFVMVAFATTSPAGLNSFTPAYNPTQFLADVATLKSRNKRILLSVGGETGGNMWNLNAITFANSACNLMRVWGFQGIDIDFETSISSTNIQTQFQPTVMANALNLLKGMTNCGLPAGVRPIITLTPQTLDMQPTVWLPPTFTTTARGLYLRLLDQPNVRSNVNWVQTQYYNSGSMNGFAQGTVDFITSQAYYLLNTVRLLPSQVALGFPSSPSAAGSGYIDSSVVNNAFTCLYNGTRCGSFVPPQKYSVLGPMLWSINRDSSGRFASALRNHFRNY